MVLAGGVVAVLIAFLPSGAQLLVLRRRTRKASGWLVVSLAGLAGGLTAAAVVVRWGLVEVVPWLTEYDFPSAKALAPVGAVTGLVYGLVTMHGIEGTGGATRTLPQASLRA
jgi:hypothetical protein